MKAFLIRNGSIALGLILGGAVMLLALPVMMDERGAAVSAVLQTRNVVAALAVLLLCVAAATGVAVVASRLVNACVGWFVLGGAIFVLNFRLATMNEILLAGSLAKIVVELVLWTFIALGAALVVFKLGGPLRDVHPDEDGREPSPLFSVEALKAAAAGILLLPVVWFLTVSELKGQAFGAVFVGALAAGLVGRLVSPHVQPILLFASPLLFAAVGALIGVIMVDESPQELFRLRTLPPVLRITPIDFLCGTLMGVSVGYGWARSFLHHEDEEHAHRSIQPTT